MILDFFRFLHNIEPALRFNGTCPQKDEPFQKSKGKELYITYEDCILCKEHCIKPKDRIPVVDWPELKYPGKDPKCVGFCPGKSSPSSLVPSPSLSSSLLSYDLASSDLYLGRSNPRNGLYEKSRGIF